jgi:hypothetical protein
MPLDPSLIVAAASAAAAYLGARGTTFLDAVLKPVGDEIGKDLLARYKARRAKNLAEVAAMAEDMAKDAGLTPQPIPGRILFPILEGASVEDDPELKKLWAKLLANAADPSNKRRVTPAFAAILEQLSPEEALMLEMVYTMTPGGGDEITGVYYMKRPDGSRREFRLPYGSFEALSDNLHRLGLVDFKFGRLRDEQASRLPPPLQPPPTFSKLYEGLPLSPLGRVFMAAVTREPKDPTP